MQVTPGAKMLYLIRRRPSTSRDELVAHWFANHMPLVIEGQAAAQARGKLHANRYIATLFNTREEIHTWDGVAQLWWDRALPRPDTPFGEPPSDTFQAKAEPYVPWATTEYVVLDARPHLDSAPLTLNAPYPMTRSGFHKVTFLVSVHADTDYDTLFKHWLEVHVPNVKGVMQQVGGFGYVVSHSVDPTNEPFAGMAELYFHERAGWDAYRAAIEADGMEQWVTRDMQILHSDTEMVGIP